MKFSFNLDIFKNDLKISKLLCEYYIFPSKEFQLRLIPQGRVDKNNLGPDCLAGPKALDPPIIADNQPFNCTTFI